MKTKISCSTGNWIYYSREFLVLSVFNQIGFLQFDRAPVEIDFPKVIVKNHVS